MCRLIRKIATYDWSNPYTGIMNERHVFHMAAPHETEDAWTWIETGGGEVLELEGYVFQFHWIALDSGIELVANQADYLDAICYVSE